MMAFFRRAAALILFSALIPAAPPALADDTEWLHGTGAELQALDKITARVARITAEVGEPLRYGSMQITVHVCTYRPPTLPPENAAFIEVRDVDHDGTVAAAPLFNGWMFASSPAVNALEHPVYDVSVLACSNS